MSWNVHLLYDITCKVSAIRFAEANTKEAVARWFTIDLKMLRLEQTKTKAA